MEYVRPKIINTTKLNLPQKPITPQLSFRTSYNNYSMEVLTIVTAHGNRYNLDPMGQELETPALEIEHTEERGRYRNRISRVQENSTNPSCGEGRQFYDLSSLKYGGCLYIKEYGILVAFAAYAGNLIHPHATEGSYISTGNETGVTLELIDNYDEVSELYADIHGEVIKIKAQVDRGRESGLYVRTYEKPNKAGGKANTLMKFYPMEQVTADNQTGLLANLFPTRQLARNAVEAKAAREEKVKTDNERVVEDLQKQIRALADTREMHQKEFEHETKMHSMNMKHRSDERAFERNEASGMFKLVPTILTFGMALFAIVKK